MKDPIKTAIPVDLPFSYVVQGVAFRERIEKWHIVLDTFPFLVPSRTPGTTVSVVVGLQKSDFPVVGGTMLFPCASYMNYRTGDVYDTYAATEGERIVEGVLEEYATQYFSWPDAPVPVRQQWVSGTVRGPRSMKTSGTSNRDNRLDDAREHADRHLSIVDGRVCTSACEPLYQISIFRTGDEIGDIRVSGPFGIEHMKSVVEQPSGIHRNIDRAYVRPDELARLLEAYPTVIRSHNTPEIPITLTGEVSGIAWKTDSRAATSADTLCWIFEEFNRTVDRKAWTEAPASLRQIVTRGHLAALDHASGMDVADRLMESIAEVSKAMSGGRPHSFVPAPEALAAKKRLNHFKRAATILGWDIVPASRRIPVDDPAEEAVLMDFSM